MSEEKLKEIEDNLLQLNQKISLKFIGMRKTPNEFEMQHINREIGEAIKSIREIRENE